MKKVFQAQLSVEFIEPLKCSLKKVYSFASSDGIVGEITIDSQEMEDNKTYRLDLSVITERKRRFKDFEAYLELIKTTLGGQNKVSVMALKDIRVTKSRVGIENTQLLESQRGYQILQDEDLNYLLVKEDNQMIINCYQNLKEAQEDLLKRL